MIIDRIDRLQRDWCAQRPDLDPANMGVVLRIQLMAKRLTDQAADALNQVGLEWWEYDVLSALRRQGQPYQMAATELAQANMLTTGAMTNRVDRLLARSLVDRSADRNDRRRVLVRLTKQGLALVDRATEARFNAADDGLSELTPGNRERLSGLLRELVLVSDADSV